MICRGPQKGFTLIELMVVIVIVAILAAIAIPGYIGNVTRAKIAEGISLMAPVKSSIAEYYTVNGSFAYGDSGTAFFRAGVIARDPLSYATKIVKSITVSATSGTEATIVIAYNAINFAVDDGATMVFTAKGGSHGVTWSCNAGGTLPDRYRPATCAIGTGS